MRIVVTGGAGFIGSALCRMLVAERGASVLNIDKLTATASIASLKPIAQSPRYSFRKADIAERERVAALLHAFAPDAIIHAAFERSVSPDIAQSIETNVIGTWRLLEAARDYWSTLPAARQQKFRFLSVSGTGEALSPATAARAGADELVTAWHTSYGLPTIVSKAAATFGPCQFPREAIAATVTGAIDGKTTEAAAGEPRAWLYIEDHVRALIAMLESGAPGATYSLAGNGLLVPSAVAGHVRNLIARHGGARGLEAMATRRHEQASATKLSIPSEPASATRSRRLEQDTGWRADETVDSALSKTVRWYLANEAWWRPLSASGDAHGLLRIA